MNTKTNLISVLILIIVLLVFLPGCTDQEATADMATAGAMSERTSQAAEVAANETGTSEATEATKAAEAATGTALAEKAKAESEASKTAQSQATETALFEATIQAEQNATGTASVRAFATSQAWATATAMIAKAFATSHAHATASAITKATAAAVVQSENLTLIAAIQERSPFSGPRSGTLQHNDDEYFEAIYGNVNLQDFVAEAYFTTDSEGSREGNRDIGFILRTANESFFVLVVRLNGYWQLDYVDKGEFNRVQDGEILNLNTDGTPNRLIVYAEGNDGLLFANEQFIAELDLSDLLSAGDILAATGLRVGNETVGEETTVDDFAIWSVGQAPLTTPPDSGEQPPVGPSSSSLLQTMQAVHGDFASFGGLIDVALREGIIDCGIVVSSYDRIAGAPIIDVSGSSAVAQNAHAGYRAAVVTFTDGARDMAQNCRDFLAAPDAGGGIPFQQWGLARQRVNDASDILHQALQSLEA